MTTTLYDEATRQSGFYVPRFEVKIEGANLPRDVARDVRRVTYKDDVDGLDSFDMVVNNWDDATRSYKYIGSETAAQLAPGHPDYARISLFEPCGKEVVVRMGYGDDLTTMLRGTFTTMQPSYGDGSADLTVSGINVLHQLRRKQFTHTWAGLKDSAIAKDIAKLTDQGKKRFPMPIVIDPKSMASEPDVPLVTQDNKYDIDFLFQRARTRGYVVFIQEEDKDTKRPRQLYFGPSQPGAIPGIRQVSFELAWGRSLIDFKPSIKTAKQIGKVTVKGWNRKTKQAISETVSMDDPKITANKDLRRLIEGCQGREEMVVDEPVFTKAQARERAIAILHDQTKQLVTAEVRVVGLPDLRAGQIVVIKELGARLSGKYFITKTQHTIDDSGYVTSFNCRREGGLK